MFAFVIMTGKKIELPFLVTVFSIITLSNLCQTINVIEQSLAHVPC